MSLKLALRALRNLGLTDEDSRVYIYLAKKGPHEEEDLASAMKLTESQLGDILERLTNRGMVNSRRDPDRVFAVSFEKVFDEFVKAATEQAKALQANRKELLSSWQSMIENNPSNN